MTLPRILFLALILRLVIAPLGEHGDVINYYYWAKDIWQNGIFGFYDRNIANAMRPTYPPVTSYLFYLIGGLHQLIWQILWFINSLIIFFPSNLIFWWESERGWYFINKLPSVVADLGIVFTIYKFTLKLFNKRLALIGASIFAFLPTFWYTSALWGQTDSVYALFLILAFYLLFKKNFILSFVIYGLAILTKPTPIFPLAIYLIFWLRNVGFKKGLLSIIIFLTITLFLYLPFHPNNLVPWIIQFYHRSLGGELSYIVANSFNIWGLLFGFKNVADTTLIFNVPAYTWGYFLFILLSIPILFKSFICKDINKLMIYASTLSFAAFLVLPRMHERYFFPTLLLMLVPALKDKQLMTTFLVLTTLHLVNLYHFWWIPKVDFLIWIFSQKSIEALLILFNIGLFALLYNHYIVKRGVFSH